MTLKLKEQNDSVLTLISIILDETGSMNGMEESVVDSFNEFINTQKNVEGDCKVSLTQFDDSQNWTSDKPNVRVIFENKDIQKVRKLELTDYNPGGMTNLYDAIGVTINKLDEEVKQYKSMPTVIVVINTDGFENSSKKFTGKQINEMITTRDKQNWKFVFMGADLSQEDSLKIATSMGISASDTLGYNKNMHGATVRGMASATSSYRNLVASSSLEDAKNSADETGYFNITESPFIKKEDDNENK